MLQLMVRRGLTAAIMLFVVATLIFSALFLVPGDPAELLLSSGGDVPSPAAIETLRAKMGLDRPIAEQFGSFIWDTVRLDFGESIVDGSSIAELIANRLPRTVELIVVAAILALLIAIPAGTFAALNAGSLFDYICSGIVAILDSVPGFVVATIFIYFFATVLRVLPAGGYVAPSQDLAAHLRVLVLPALSVSISLITVIFRMTRASVLEMRDNDWVRTAKAKGLRYWQVVRRHILRNSLGPIITVVGIHLGLLLGSTVIVEFVYNWPGLSGILVTAVEQRDYPTVRAVILVVSALFIAINLFVEVMYGFLDPRIRLQ